LELPDIFLATCNKLEASIGLLQFPEPKPPGEL
jgi:hypothetical protein